MQRVPNSEAFGTPSQMIMLAVAPSKTRHFKIGRSWLRHEGVRVSIHSNMDAFIIDNIDYDRLGAGYPNNKLRSHVLSLA